MKNEKKPVGAIILTAAVVVLVIAAAVVYAARRRTEGTNGEDAVAQSESGEQLVLDEDLLSADEPAETDATLTDGEEEAKQEEPDNPSRITDLRVVRTNWHSVLLEWSVPKSDEFLGLAVSYDIRYSETEITDDNFDACEKADVTVNPKSNNLKQKMYVHALETGTEYYFAMKTNGVDGEVTKLSNVISAVPESPGVPDKVTVYSLKELQNEINSAKNNGKIITLAAGVYDQTSAITISNRHNITIQGETDDYNDTVIKGPGIEETGRCSINVRLENATYITIQNLTISDSGYHAIQVTFGSHYFYADNIKTWNNGESGFKVTSASQADYDDPYSDYGVIENCYIGNETTASNMGPVEGIDGIATKGWVVRNNTFKNIKHPGESVGYAVFFKANSQDTVMENNLFIDCDIALSFGGGGSGPAAIFRYTDTEFEHRGGIMRNNVVWGGKDTGVFVRSAYGYKIYNNTVWSSEQFPWASICFRGPNNYGGAKGPTNGEIYNNIFRFPIENGADPNVDYSLMDLRNNMAGSQDGLSLDLFVDVENGDFHLSSSADEAIGWGLNLWPVVQEDRDGNPRPETEAFDIGAYQR